VKASSRICPRCGSPVSYFTRKQVSWVRGDGRASNVYLYAVHREGKKKRFCYLGPEQYVHVAMLHPISLRGMMPEGDYWRLLEYLREITEFLEHAEIREEDRGAVSRELGDVVNRLLKIRLSLA